MNLKNETDDYFNLSDINAATLQALKHLKNKAN